MSANSQAWPEENEMLREPLYVLGKILLSLRNLSPDQADTVLRQAMGMNFLRGPLAKWRTRSLNGKGFLRSYIRRLEARQ